MRKTIFTKKITTFICLTALLSCIFMTACSGNGSTTADEFKSACENDGMTVTENADTSSLSDYANLQTYSTAIHGTENILLQYMAFSDKDSASAAFDKYKKSIDPGEEGSISTVDTTNYTTVVAEKDAAYTKAILAGKLIISASGPTMYKGELNRILLKFGYQ